MKTTIGTMVILAVGFGVATGGTVQNFLFSSDSLGENRAAQAYLPDGYDPDDPDGYPAIYFLHGANGSYSTYGEIIPVLDSEIAAGRIQPVIMIKPDGGGCNWGFFNGCNWSNSELQGDYEDYVVNDVVNAAEIRFNIASAPGKRAIMGHSMGGFGAMQAALDHPDLFCAVASHSSYLYFDDLIVVHLPLLHGEQSGPPPWDWYPTLGTFTSGWFLFSGAFSPNLDNPHHLVDFPVDELGEIIPDTWLRWKEHDPAVLAQALAPGEAPAIFFDCGTYDGFALHPFNVSFDAYLTSLGIPHEWQSYVGDHGSNLGPRFAISLNFLDDAMNDVSAATDMPFGRARLLQAYPNPFNPQTRIAFDLPNREAVTLQVFDMAGRLVRNLIAAEPHAPGRHEVVWNGRDDRGRRVSSGTYFYRLEAGAFSETKRMVLIK
jgi:S-formylglutathione hydrolase FrmB